MWSAVELQCRYALSDRHLCIQLHVTFPLLDVVATLFDVMNMEGLYLYMSWAPTMLYCMAIQLIRVGENLKFKIFDELEKNKLLKLTIQAIRMFE